MKIIPEIHTPPLSNFTDVVYLGGRGRVIDEVRELVEQKRLSSVMLPIERADEVLERLDNVGTVIIDPCGLDPVQQQHLPEIIEVLERESIGVILLAARAEASGGSMRLPASGNGFSMTSALERTSVDELWVKISVNLSYRRKSAEMMVGRRRRRRSAAPSRTPSPNAFA